MLLAGGLLVVPSLARADEEANALAAATADSARDSLSTGDRPGDRPGEGDPLVVHPAAFTLVGRDAAQRLVILGLGDDGDDEPRDLTREARFRSLSPEVVEVDSDGIVRPLTDGQGVVAIAVGDREVCATVDVRQSAEPLPVSFQQQVQPILARLGCSAGACHGKARGQNGFQLSLLGFDPDFDHAALTTQARGRRVSWAAPEQSLLLEKATARVPHGGGLRLAPESPEYDLLLRWITAGTPRHLPDEPTLARIELWPPHRRMQPGEQQQVMATAHYSDGTARDVTRWTAFSSSESAVVAVDEHGLVRAGPVPGEAAIIGRFLGLIDTTEIDIPLPEPVPAEYYTALPRHNFIDTLVWDKLQSLGLTPSPPADDARFLRRAHLDLIGRLPTPDEVRAFLADDDPAKREHLVDRLLERPEYGDHWANLWVDLLRPNPYRVGIKAVLNYDAWIRDALRRNVPHDEFVRGLLTAQGSTWHNGAVTLYRDRRSPDEVATLASQLFLGVRLECAKCHQHPFERWSQADFYSFAAYFAQVGYKGTGLSPPISGSEEIVLVKKSGSVTHPLTGQPLPPRPLFGTAPPIEPESDPRLALAAWMTSDENPYFAQVAANRIWAKLMGRGLVEPVDDLRATNPPTNAPLLEALAEEFRRQRYDNKALIRAIANSYVYGLASTPSERNLADTRNHSRHYRKRMRAEVLLDAVSDVTGIADRFDAMPPDSRAVEIWTHRVSSLFLDTFGRPDPNQDPPCERLEESTVTQALHLMNAPALHAKVTSDEGRAARLAHGPASSDEIVDELYLLVYSRYPDDDERQFATGLLATAGDERRAAVEDLLWALLNSAEFIVID